MPEYRISKYDPARRNSSGAYLADEWTFFAQIGQEIGGSVLTEAEYRRVEDAYVATAVAFMRESGGAALRVAELSNNKGYQEPGLSLVEGALLHDDVVVARVSAKPSRATVVQAGG